MPDPRWSLADTHCVWCGRENCDTVHGWYDARTAVASLRATVEAQGDVIEQMIDWVVAMGYPYDFRTDDPPPETLRRSIAEAWWRKWDQPDLTPEEAYELVAEEGQWGSGEVTGDG